MLGLLRTRSRFRTLYLGDALSMMGDWLTYVAVGLLALRGPQGLVGVALVQMAHSLPQAATAPIAGWLSDRIDRRAMLIAASLARGAVTVAMAIAATRGEVVWVELLLFLRMAGASFVLAPSRAALPMLVSKDELEPANRLMGTSWAVLFAAGVALGGVVTGLFGPAIALWLDAGTFALAALVFIAVGPLPPTVREPARQEASWLRDARRFPERLEAALAKAPTMFASGASYVVLHALLGPGAGVAFGLGGLHALRGVGNGVGPWLFRRLGDRRAVRAGLFTVALGLCLLVVNHPLARGLACLFWGLGVGATWVGATVWLQRITPDGILGRYAAVDLGASGSASAAGGLAAALVCVAFGPLVAALSLAAAALGLWALTRIPRRARALAAGVVTLLVINGVTPSPADAQLDLERELASRGVTDARFVTTELWTWTTDAQAAQLRADHVLLRATAEDGERSPYQRALDTLAAQNGPEGQLARDLTTHPALARRRYAWTTPYGTAIARGSRPYGRQLVRITLAADAWTVRFAPDEHAPFTVMDARGRRVALRDAIATPARIGAVYHVREDARGGAFREYVVHGGVTGFSLATAAIRERLRADARVLAALARRTRRDARGRSMRPYWRAPGSSLAARFAATMPFDTYRHRPSPESFAALIDALRVRTPRGPPLMVRVRGE